MKEPYRQSLEKSVFFLTCVIRVEARTWEVAAGEGGSGSVKAML